MAVWIPELGMELTYDEVRAAGYRVGERQGKRRRGLG